MVVEELVTNVTGIRIMEHVVIALVGVIMASIIVPTSLIAMLKAMPNGRTN